MLELIFLIMGIEKSMEKHESSLMTLLRIFSTFNHAKQNRRANRKMVAKYHKNLRKHYHRNYYR